MRRTLDEVVSIVNAVASGLTYAKEALRVAKKVHGDDREVSQLLKYCYADLQKAVKALEGE